MDSAEREDRCSAEATIDKLFQHIVRILFQYVNNIYPQERTPSGDTFFYEIPQPGFFDTAVLLHAETLVI